MNGSTEEPLLRLALGGDTMLGRIVAETMRQLGPSYPLEALAGCFSWGQIRLVNLECCLTRLHRPWRRTPKMFHFGVQPSLGVAALRSAGIQIVSLANNHLLDFEEEALRTTIEELDRAGIAHAGAGLDLAQAFAPVLLDAQGTKVGIVSFSDHPPEFAARADSPGIAYVDLESKEDESVERILASTREARRQGAAFVMASAHIGPNFDDHPSELLVRVAHRLIDGGLDLLFGHSAHAFLGVEIYRGRPIFYGAGDLVDDYYVGPERNDLGFVYRLEWSPRGFRRLECLPVLIADCRAQPAPAEDADLALARLRRLSAELGTYVEIERCLGHIAFPSPEEAVGRAVGPSWGSDSSSLTDP